MKNILSLSVHRGPFPKSFANKTPDGEVFRAILWNGQVAKHNDSTLWVGEFAHQNLFESLRELKRSAKEWSARRRNCFVEGIDSCVPCWPIDYHNKPLSDEELEIETESHITHCGGYKGLLCRIKLSEGVYQATLYDILPLPPNDDDASSLVHCSYWSQNAFLATSQLQVMAQASAREQGISVVRGLDDKEVCWPEGFGTRRFS